MPRPATKAFYLLFLFAIGLTQFASAQNKSDFPQSQFPWTDTALPIDQRVDALISRMTLEQKKINDLLAMHGIDLKREELSSKVGLERVLAAPLTGMPTVELRVLVEQVRTLNVAIRSVESIGQSRMEITEGNHIWNSIQ